MVVPQLVQRLLAIPGVRSSNPVIGKNLYWTYTINCIENTKIKKKRPGMAHFFKLMFISAAHVLNHFNPNSSVIAPKFFCFSKLPEAGRRCVLLLWSGFSIISTYDFKPLFPYLLALVGLEHKIYYILFNVCPIANTSLCLILKREFANIKQKETNFALTFLSHLCHHLPEIVHLLRHHLDSSIFLFIPIFHSLGSATDLQSISRAVMVKCIFR